MHNQYITLIYIYISTVNLSLTGLPQDKCCPIKYRNDINNYYNGIGSNVERFTWLGLADKTVPVQCVSVGIPTMTTARELNSKRAPLHGKAPRTQKPNAQTHMARYSSLGLDSALDRQVELHCTAPV